MKTIFKILILSILFIITQNVMAQSNYLKGVVNELNKDNKKVPLLFANVFWLGTQTGTTTDDHGRFSLKKPSATDWKLVVSYVGYKSDTLLVPKGQNKIDIVLAADRELASVEIRERTNGSYISGLKSIKTEVITTAGLQKLACCNLSESFENNATVDVGYSDAITGAKQIQMLGLAGIYSQIMTENLPSVHGLSQTYGLNYIPGSWMESIQISKGTASVVNGFESVTGQINVEYKKPENSEKLFVSLYGNSNGRLEANVNSAVKLNDKLSTMVLVHADDFQNVIDRNDDGFLDLPKLTTYSLFNRWDYILPGKMASKFGIKYIDEDRNGGQASFDKSNFTDDTTGITAGAKAYGLGIRTKRLEVFWKNGFFFPNHPNSSLGLVLSGVNHEQKGFYGINHYYGHEKSLYANLIFNTQIKNPGHKIAAGLSFLYDDYIENYRQKQLTYLYELNGGGTDYDLFTLIDYVDVTYNLNRTERVPGAFAEYTFDYKDKLTLIAGLRGDYHNDYGFFATPRFHLRYKPDEKTTFRASAGKGYRTANVLSENSGIFISQRKLVFFEKLDQEEAWNFGANITKEFKLFTRTAEFSIDAYRTSFIHQVIADMDSMPNAVYFYNLDGKSYSNSLQAQLTFLPLKSLSVTMAYRRNDVKMEIGGRLRDKPFANNYKGLITLSYATRFDKWKFDITGQFNGSARLPDTYKMPAKLQRTTHSPEYFNLLAQITRKFKYFDIYLGGENITGFTQGNLIVEYWKPYHTHFDGSMVWGPVTGALAYAGLRYTLK